MSYCVAEIGAQIAALQLALGSDKQHRMRYIMYNLTVYSLITAYRYIYLAYSSMLYAITPWNSILHGP